MFSATNTNHQSFEVDFVNLPGMVLYFILSFKYSGDEVLKMLYIILLISSDLNSPMTTMRLSETLEIPCCILFN